MSLVSSQDMQLLYHHEKRNEHMKDVRITRKNTKLYSLESGGNRIIIQQNLKPLDKIQVINLWAMEAHFRFSVLHPTCLLHIHHIRFTFPIQLSTVLISPLGNNLILSHALSWRSFRTGSNELCSS